MGAVWHADVVWRVFVDLTCLLCYRPAHQSSLVLLFVLFVPRLMLIFLSPTSIMGCGVGERKGVTLPGKRRGTLTAGTKDNDTRALNWDLIDRDALMF